ncbi:DUF3486 family protein [Chromohalobacter israelensis]|uniref:DUF3486 family protein n=1 Tax=Chromohalobacter israelensis TaxID=141390 RepID=UPI000FFEEFB4|nr:DUF3486 family protein [Chromohalobacter salexigens]RXE49202.1 hypothetical protein B4O83_14985 [Chromohalobacter salexigens]
MPPRNQVYSLPPEVRDELNERLVSTGFQGYSALADWLAERGYNVSRSSVHRYGQDLQDEFDEAMGDVRKTTELAKAMAADQEDESGHLIDATARMVQDQLLRITIAMRKAEQDPAKAAKQIGSVTKALADIGRVSLSQKKWAAEVRAEVAKEAAEKAEASMATQGMSRAAIDSIKRDILGIA